MKGSVNIHVHPFQCISCSVSARVRLEGVTRSRQAVKSREEGRQAPEPQPIARGTRKSMMKQNPFPEKRKKREEGRQAPEPRREEG